MQHRALDTGVTLDSKSYFVIESGLSRGFGLWLELVEEKLRSTSMSLVLDRVGVASS